MAEYKAGCMLSVFAGVEYRESLHFLREMAPRKHRFRKKILKKAAGPKVGSVVQNTAAANSHRERRLVVKTLQIRQLC